MKFKIAENKKEIITILFYVASVIFVLIINLSGKFKSGPCNPGLDLISAFLLIVFNIVLLITTAVSTFILKKKTKNLFFIHLFIFLIWSI
jgi:hypothetical protein